MKIKKFRRRDEEILLVKKWWKSRQDIDFDRELLSDFGFMAFSEDRGVAACFLFPVRRSRVCWLGWPISDPESTKEERNVALNLVFDTIHEKAKELGYRLIWTTSGLGQVQERLESSGYVCGDKNINQYWKELS